MTRRPPSLEALLRQTQGPRPVAFVLAGHNGSGKSTMWYTRLAGSLRIPLVNADRMMLSILPDPDPKTGRIPGWAQQLRDEDVRWQILSQEGVRVFKRLVMDQRMPFAFETVFSHWKPLPDGRHESKADDIRAMQRAGYYVVLLFVGLTSADFSVLRVSTRKQQGGHDVDRAKLVSRFPRTQAAVGHAAPLADMTLMFDNSREEENAFTLVRAQKRRSVLFDARDPQFQADPELRAVCDPWLEKVAGPFRPRRTRTAKPEKPAAKEPAAPSGTPERST
ncbi:zeta toxin family protein [Variovorax sp. J22R24]|uniref:zeta toxin family protein n=1 Tax=Variovorax gracilis TaxID=3053502 RepID=UPI002578AE79|nr:zeta toxin family protein [Variovorax sp. J22R24]MDM0106288.1 zeta toxin family protein [Variovorax sp. J22R24]